MRGEQPSAHHPCEVVDRAERSRREERLAGARHDSHAITGVLLELANQRRLPDPRLSRDESDPTRARQGRRERLLEGRERPLPFEEGDGGVGRGIRSLTRAGLSPFPTRLADVEEAETTSRGDRLTAGAGAELAQERGDVVVDRAR